MKLAKKIFALALALVMVMALGVSAFAATITIEHNTPDPAGEGTTAETYTAYKILDVTVNGDNYAYSTTNKAIADVFTAKGFTVNTAVDGSYIIAFTGDAATFPAETVKALASALKALNLPVAATSTDGTLELANDGYYLVVDSLGSALILDTVGGKDKTIQSKNDYPSLDKQVQTADGWGESTSADAGAKVNFKLTVTVPETVNGEIVIVDTLPEGMSFVEMTSGDGVTASAEGQVVTFTIANPVAGETVITYTATLDGGAETAKAYVNKAVLRYANYETVEENAEVYTYEFDVFKYSLVDGEKTALAGAGFVLQNAEDKYYAIDENGVVSWVDDIAEATEYTTDAETGIITFTGLANGTYTLIEKTVPAGYNAPTGNTKVTINGANLKGEAAQIEVLNQAGSLLPSTGGIGTTIFYVVGGVLVAAALVLLITKKRMSAKG